MICPMDGYKTSNKKSFSNHIRWCEGRMETKRINYSRAKTAEKNPQWKGDEVGYDALHGYIRLRFPKPKLCKKCKLVKPYDLCNISGKYKRDLSDWEWLCRSCHMKLDGRLERLHKNNIKKKG